MTYKVKVKVIEEKEYEVTVEAPNFAKAEDAAASRYVTAEINPPVKRLRFEIDSERLTYQCEGCDGEISQELYESEGLCTDCAECEKKEAVA